MMKSQKGFVDLAIIVWLAVMAHWFNLGYTTAEDKIQKQQHQVINSSTDK